MTNEKDPMKILAHMAKQLFQLKQTKSIYESELKKINALIEQCESGLLKRMDMHEIESFKTESGSVFKKKVLRASVLAGDRDKLANWLEKNGHGSLVTRYVFPKTLEGWVREQIRNEREVPNMVKVKEFEVPSTRRN